MRKWDSEPTSKIGTHVCKLRGKRAAKKGPSKMAVGSAALETVEGNQSFPRYRRGLRMPPLILVKGLLV